MPKSIPLRTVLPLVLALPIGAQTTIRVTAGIGGAEPNGTSASPHISRDGRFVVFSSEADNLDANDTSVGPDVFLYDANSGTVALVSARDPGPSSSSPITSPGVSDDGNIVVFASFATNLAPGSIGFHDIFVRDRAAGTTTRVTSGWLGNSSEPEITPDGRYIVFESQANNVVSSGPDSDVILHDRQTGTFALVSQNTGGTPGNGHSAGPSISADGRIIAFTSEASNFLLSDTNAVADVFVRDVVAGTTRRASIGVFGNALALPSTAGNVSGDGRRIVFMTSDGTTTAGDTNGVEDVFYFDRTAGLPGRASAPPSRQGGNGFSNQGTISRNGRYIAFRSAATDLVGIDPTPVFPDLYVKDLETGAVEIISLSSTGTASNVARTPSISANGRFVAFVGHEGLVPGDAIGFPEVYIRDRGAIVYTTPCAGDNLSTPCPCGNPGSLGNGCENYGLTGGARLVATGSPSVTGDTIQLAVTGLPVFPTAMGFSQGDALQNNGLGVGFGDGVRCIGGQVLRLRQRQSITGESAYGFGVPGDPAVSLQGQVGPVGGTRFYQVSYRSVGSFCFQQKVNWSNSIAIVWEP